MHLPATVQSYIDHRVVKTAGAAYLEFDQDGGLRSWGGRLDFHGIVEPTRGKRISEVAPFLNDVTPPAKNQRLVLSQVQTLASHYSDIHLFQTEGSEWVLFLDSTDENRSLEVVQQCFNELTLLRDLHSRELEKHKEGIDTAGLVKTVETLKRETERLLGEQQSRIEGASFSHILDELSIVVAQRRAGAEFRIEKCPRWFEALVDGVSCGDLIDIVKTFPFLESFFEDAEVVWDENFPGPLRSGFWIEEDCDGNEIALQATALRHGGHSFLLIMFPSIDYREKQNILTRARSSELEHEKLRKEIEKKEILLHCIVHDLAGPLHGVQGALELISMSELTDKNRELLELCDRQCETQQRLIRDILNAFAAEIASPQSTEIKAEEAPDALKAIQDVRDILGPSFMLRCVNLEIINQVPEAIDRRLAIDKDSLCRALINLAENALWHSLRGQRVVLILSLLGSELLIAVEDQGPGVPAGMQERLFQKFSQGRRHSKGKVGLGLYFCRITAEKWGGQVGQTNLPEGGSRFWIRLPLFVSQESTQKTGAAPA